MHTLQAHGFPGDEYRALWYEERRRHPGKDEVAALASIRQKLAGHSTLEGLQAVVKTLSSSSSNVEALVSLQKNLGS